MSSESGDEAAQQEREVMASPDAEPIEDGDEELEDESEDEEEDHESEEIDERQGDLTSKNG